MYSNRAEHSNRRQCRDKSARQWDDYDDSWEERREPYRDSYHKHGGDRHSSIERTNRTRGYSDSPKRRYSTDTSSRDGSRRSPVRGRVSSPWRRYAKDPEDDHRYRREPEDRKRRLSPDSFSHKRVTKEFKHALSHEEDLKYWKTSQDSRHRHEEYPYRQQHDDYKSSPYYKDRDHYEGRWDHSEERTPSQERSTKSCAKSREKDECRSKGYDYHRQNRQRSPLHEPCGQLLESDITNQTPPVPEHNSSSGFQRFLDLLNKGVNVDMLTKVVTQASSEVRDETRSPASFNAAERQWSPSSATRRHGNRQNNHCWTESEGSQRMASPQPHHRSFSPKRCSPPNEKFLLRRDTGQSHCSLNSRSSSPSVVDNNILTPEDEHKHRQMQDVLQAIGMDLGSEELGQMSHRIQERLYGKRDRDRVRRRRGSTERDRRASSPRHRSRSSSSNRSNFSSLTRDSYMKKDSCSGSARGEVIEVHQIQVHQGIDYDQNDSSSSLQDSEQCEPNSQESTAALQTLSPSAAYNVLPPPPFPPAIPTYPPVNYSQLPYPALHPSLPPNLAPSFPHVRPNLFLPPYLPYPIIRPLNIFPAVLSQTSHLLPQHLSNPPSTIFNQASINPLQPLNTAQKSKTQGRPRCLQVIETKQPG